jgi:hypothetical protein
MPQHVEAGAPSQTDEESERGLAGISSYFSFRGPTHEVFTVVPPGIDEGLISLRTFP